MPDYLVYDKKLSEVPQQDRPDPGVAFVCLDEKAILGSEMWIVSYMVDDLGSWLSIQKLGLFWRRDIAELFAAAYANADDVCMGKVVNNEQ